MYKFLYAYCIWHFICVLVFPSSIFTQYNKICECSLKTKTAQYQFASTMTLQLTHCHLRKSGLKENPDFPTGTTLRWCSSRKYNHSDMTRRQQSHMEGWKVCVCKGQLVIHSHFPAVRCDCRSTPVPPVHSLRNPPSSARPLSVLQSRCGRDPLLPWHWLRGRGPTCPSRWWTALPHVYKL